MEIKSNNEVSQIKMEDLEGRKGERGKGRKKGVWMIISSVPALPYSQRLNNLAERPIPDTALKGHGEFHIDVSRPKFNLASIHKCEN